MSTSAADLRSILALPSSSSHAASSQSKKQASTSARKPEGISRELYSLIGPTAPSLATQLAKPQLKQKPKLGGGGGSVKWEWRTFKNAVRSDGLALGHWVKANSDPNEVYPFAKYDVRATVYTYSQDEYNRLLEDPEWTKEETDYLMNLVQEFDHRWYPIHDRYEYADSSRSLEDLKDRYYSVCRKLVRNRPWAGDEASKTALLSSLQFDKERETTRKKYIESLENRTPEQIEEENALYIELKRLEQRERKFKKEREDLLRTLLGVESGLADVVIDDDGSLTSANITIDTKKKKKGNDLDSPSTPVMPSPSGSVPPAKRSGSTKSTAYDLQHCIHRTDPSSVASGSTKLSHTAVHLRSYRIPTLKAPVAPKITQALAEVGVNAGRLIMPTRENVTQLEALIHATMALLDTKKVVDKVEQDIRIEKERLGISTTNGEDASPEGSTTHARRASMSAGVGAGPASADVDSPMEVDEGADDDEGRAQSVLSTRSARSRKQSRRSVSVSSVDTSATGRANTKRQKRA